MARFAFRIKKKRKQVSGQTAGIVAIATACFCIVLLPGFIKKELRIKHEGVEVSAVFVENPSFSDMAYVKCRPIKSKDCAYVVAYEYQGNMYQSRVQGMRIQRLGTQNNPLPLPNEEVKIVIDPKNPHEAYSFRAAQDILGALSFVVFIAVLFLGIGIGLIRKENES